MGARETMPPGTLRRAEGINAIKRDVLRSRWGENTIFVLPAAAHSLYRWNGLRYQGAGAILYKEGAPIASGLNGNRLTFVSMAPSPEVVDWLFVAGGGRLIKISVDGTVSQWGIDAPTTDFTAAVGAAGVLNGTYQYAVTFKNTVTGARSNPNPAAFTGPATVAPANQKVDLSNIPISNDPQVNAREIWRTFANQAQLFLLTTITDNSTTTYTDNAPDADLTSETIQFDNAPPSSTFNDAVGPYQGRMWWTRDPSAGNPGRVFYSPIGRPESVQGFIEINNGADPIQKLIFWGGALYAWSSAHIFQIIGFGEPFTFREVYGAFGTLAPFTVTPTHYGVLYHSATGIRLFDGTASNLVGYDAVGRWLDHQEIEGIPAFEPDVAAFDGYEFWMADSNTMAMLNPMDATWRYVKSPATAFFFEPDDQVLIAANIAGVFAPEVPNRTVDGDGGLIHFEIETPGLVSDISVAGMVQRLYFDVNTRNVLVTPTVVIDDDEFVLPPFRTLERPVPPVEIAVGRWGHVVSVRLTAQTDQILEVFAIGIDVYVPVGAPAVTTAGSPP